MILAFIGSSASGTCFAHGVPLPVTGVVTEGSGNVICDGNGTARVGDEVLFACGHTGNISAGSSTVKINGIAAARVGDPISGTVVGVITGGSGTTNAG